MAFSGYCKVKLDNWPTQVSSSTPVCTPCSVGTPTAKRYTIRFPVPAGHTDCTKRLIQGMYQKYPTTSDLSQQQLLQLLMLADRFEVSKVQTAVLDALKALSADDMNWETAIVFLDCPIHLDDHSACTQITATAFAKLRQKLGDLELVWADPGLQERLISLPHAALLHLLQHDDTRVANESTVVYTILQWWEKQQQSYTDSHVQQLKQLMQQVRMEHLDLLYISTHMMRSEAVLSCFSAQELATACNCTNLVGQLALQDASHPQLKQYPAWTAAKRPPSNHPQKMEWKLPVSELGAAVTSVLSGKESEPIEGPKAVLQGHAVQLAVEVDIADIEAAIEVDIADTDGTSSEGDTSTDRELQMGLFAAMPKLQKQAVCNVKSKFCVMLATAADSAVAGRSHNDVCFGSCTKGITGGDPGYGFDFLTLPVVGSLSWSNVEVKLKEKKMVRADDCLHFVVTNIHIS